MPILRTRVQLQNIKLFKCDVKAKSANKRFKDSICKEDVLDVLERFNYRCFYCNEALKPLHWQLDHYNPRANGGLNTFHNLVCTCKWCNLMKNALDGVAFIQKCKTIVNNNWLELNAVKVEIEDKRKTDLKRKAFKVGIKYIENNIDTNLLSIEQLKVIHTAIAMAVDRNENAINSINNKK